MESSLVNASKLPFFMHHDILLTEVETLLDEAKTRKRDVNFDSNNMQLLPVSTCNYAQSTYNFTRFTKKLVSE